MKRIGLRRLGRFYNFNLSAKRRQSHGANFTAGENETKATNKDIPVMLDEVIENLKLKPNDLFLDMTFGTGGHSEALLQRIPQLQVVALDRDPASAAYASRLSDSYPDQVTFLKGKFSDLPALLKRLNITRNSFDGILFDLGCSSIQMKTPERGFNLGKNIPLDMRMDGNEENDSVTAADIITFGTENELAKIFKAYGQEKMARKIAKTLVQTRHNFRPIKTTQDLSDLIKVVSDSFEINKKVKATKILKNVFYSLRTFVNNELNELNYGLLVAHYYLKVEGRAVAVSYNALEDHIVKRHFSNHLFHKGESTVPAILLDSLKIFEADDFKTCSSKYWQPLHKKIVLSTPQDISKNSLNKSARLQAAIKLDKDINVLQNIL